MRTEKAANVKSPDTGDSERIDEKDNMGMKFVRACSQENRSLIEYISFMKDDALMETVK